MRRRARVHLQSSKSSVREIGEGRDAPKSKGKVRGKLGDTSGDGLVGESVQEVGKDLKTSKILEDYLGDYNNPSAHSWSVYQPINLKGCEKTFELSWRNCFDRSKAIIDSVQSIFPGKMLSFIDWGCNAGFFVFELAKNNYMAVGIDNDHKRIDLCRKLLNVSDIKIPPRFFVDTLSSDAIHRHNGYDIGICLSVLHHIKNNNKIIEAFANTYKVSYIEMDGHDYGYSSLYKFFWSITPIIRTNDKYGRSTRTRRTYECTNYSDGAIYKSLKTKNFINNRAVFLKEHNKKCSVVKRERNRSTHTWIRTGLNHELEMYKMGFKYFAKLIDYDVSKDSKYIEIEYLDKNCQITSGMVDKLFRFLKSNNLFIIDFDIDSFVPHKNKLKVVDLESVFVVENSIPHTLKKYVKSKRKIALDTYNKQINRVKEFYNL